MGPATLRSDAIFDGVIHETTQVLYAKVTEAGSGDLIAAVTAKIIRVLGVFLVAAGSETIKFQSDGSVDLTGTMSLIIGVPFVLPVNQYGWLQTASGKKLNLVQGGSVQISGGLVYVLV